MNSPQFINKVTKPFDIELTLPGSKSIALRHLVISALASEPTELVGIPRCDDIDAMVDSLSRLGVGIESAGRSRLAVDPPGTLAAGEVHIDARLSGVSLRFLLAVAALRRDLTHIDGGPPLRVRPNRDMIEALRQLGCDAQAADDEGHLPISVTGPDDWAREVEVGTRVSSQYLSGLMLIAPRLPHGLTLRPKDEPVSAPYVEITRTEMERRGVPVRTSGTDTIRIDPAPYRGGTVSIEGDASAATYFAAAATLHASSVRFANLGASTTQGDFAFFDICRRLGADVEARDNTVSIQGPATLQPIGQVDMEDMSDAAPTLMAMAPFLPGATQITGLSTLRHKECDRIACPARELRKAGVAVEEGADWVRIHPVSAPRPAQFETYDDHRMAMSLAVFASQVGGCAILDPGCVAKTYTDFWEDLAEVYA
ncbi:MAG: 3-phosphoshikimate 1-carboxyvinyltransferase [Gammaproteobacteria bacterium]|nr:3-phosphoshikimate 1-carboxyvinyltransferase [Gammaproteobacteria bacterium]